ncbi:hypothetical protein [Tissierella sp. Yu-01]|uniref:hypothetical protein n=1 Tax=Tissierella sp. Yu-01 TaxID=3035694 RepID=UPI00240DCC50|nr:hypothetical protein [Tissierella sp. Yu-01]WFA07813.1 hypothetical protein P3962_08715 [Tissierella sp. Yu-01]
MENKKILKAGLISTLSLLVISLIISFYLKLDEPVFLKVYKELELPTNQNGRYMDTQLHIRYITNVNDTRLVSHVEFEEAPGLMTSAYSRDPMVFSMFNNYNQGIPGDNVGRYSVRPIYIWINAFDMENAGDDIHITKAKVHFDNGDIIEADIGEVILYADDIRPENLDFMSVGGSSDGTHTTELQATEDITLLRVEDSLLSKFNHIVELKVNATDYENISGMKLQAGDRLNIFSKFNATDDIEASMYDYDIHPKLHYEDSEGNFYTYRFRNLDYRRHGFEFMEIIKFLRARGEL